MTGLRARGEDVRRFILEKVGQHPNDITKVTAQRFGITRQAVGKHLKRLVAERAITQGGATRNPQYALVTLSEWRKAYPIASTLAEDVVWREDIEKVLGKIPDNVMRIWHHGFTEMFNNAIDHSEGTRIIVDVHKTAADTKMMVIDNGVGIFHKIQRALNLLDERHAVLELAKGKFTTDPARHSGEGIFFTSRMFDEFSIFSGDVYFTHEFGADDWVMENSKPTKGTRVWMELSNHTSRTPRKIYDQFTSGDDFGFNKTVVPVHLARYGNENLISRSQAKRLLARVELFKVVLLDFEGVPSIGQAFADEIFRVFQQQHPNIELVPMHASSEVKRMIQRARASRNENA
jgi:anti-sigma regulatory factor (Ser/Thr protein kinase)